MRRTVWQEEEARRTNVDACIQDFERVRVDIVYFERRVSAYMKRYIASATGVEMSYKRRTRRSQRRCYERDARRRRCRLVVVVRICDLELVLATALGSTQPGSKETYTL